jgi:hypothetical protein
MYAFLISTVRARCPAHLILDLIIRIIVVEAHKLCSSLLLVLQISLLKIQNKVSLYARFNMSVYPKVSGLAAWSKNCKWYGSLPLGAVVSLFCESILPP